MIVLNISAEIPDGLEIPILGSVCIFFPHKKYNHFFSLFLPSIYEGSSRDKGTRSVKYLKYMT